MQRAEIRLRAIISVLLFLLLLASVVPAGKRDVAVDDSLSFQTSGFWTPRINIPADVAIVYGIDSLLPQRLESWRRRGYRIQVMTGVAWGKYQDYLSGKYDGRKHWDEAQTARDGTRIMHGGGKDIPYMSPTDAYGNYLTEGIKRALDAGAEAVHLEEPEFFADAGYEESFRREWKSYYGDEWEPPDSSPDAQYRSSKLKYFLYRRALSQVFEFVRKYARTAGRSIRCYVPTHSLINYAHWGIVSPESSLRDVGVDGYIAQVWTGTARTPNVYEGRRKERSFETAFLEYGVMQDLVRDSTQQMWYLNDPVEDDPNHAWDDYRSNWENTLVASLLHPEVWRYEVMPWPERVFMQRYPRAESSKRGPGQPEDRILIPKAYETELQTTIRALGEMKQRPDAVRWQLCGTRNVGVLVSDTMMFERADPSPSDQNLGSFYGLAMPLLKRGIPVTPVQIERVEGAFLDRYRLLLLTYEGQKPPAPEFHEALAQWVRAGGALVVIDDDRDPYNSVHEWWNTAPLSFSRPRQDLFARLRLNQDATGMHRIGKGVVIREALSPAALSYRRDGAAIVQQLAHRAADAIGLKWQETNALVLDRGPYVIAAGLDESIPGAKPIKLQGHFVDLFDPALAVVDTVNLIAGKGALLFDLNRTERSATRVVAAACRITQETLRGDTLRLRAEGIADSEAVIRCAHARRVSRVTIDGHPAPAGAYRKEADTLLLRFRNSADSVPITVKSNRTLP